MATGQCVIIYNPVVVLTSAVTVISTPFVVNTAYK